MATELGVAYVSIVPSMAGFSKGLAPGFRSAEKEAGKSGETSGGLFGGGFKAAGVVAAAAAGVAIGAAVAGAVSSAMDIGKANDKLAAQLGLNEGEAKAAGKVAGKLYAGAYGESISEVNDAVGSVMSSIKGMRTASEADVEAMTAKVLDLSAAFEIDTGRAAQVAGQLITSGLAKDGVEAADLLTASLQKVPAAVREDILDAADEYGPFFANLGISGEKAMGMLVESSEKGMYGIDKTGDALKEFGIRATDLSKASGDAYSTIGLDQLEMSNALLAGGDIAAEAFEKIVGGIQGVENPAARAEAAIALFGTPIEDLSVNEIPKFLDSLVSAESGLGDVGGAAEAMGKTLNDNASTNLESFKRQITTAFVDFVGGKALPALEKLAGFLSTNVGPVLTEITGGITAFGAAWRYNDGDITSSGFPGFMEKVAYQARQAFDRLTEFGGWLRDNADTIKNVAIVITAIMLPALVRLGVGATVSAAKQLVAWTLVQGGAIKSGAVYVAQSVLMIGRWAWMGVKALFHAGRMAAAWLIAMGPIGWVTAAVIGIAALVIANWDKISKFTSKVWGAITAWVTKAWSDIKARVSAAIVWVANWIATKMSQIKAGWDLMWKLISNYVSSVWSGIKATVSAAIDWVRNWINTKVTQIKTGWAIVWDAIKTKVTTIWDGIKTVISNAWTGVKSTIQKLIDFVKTKPGQAFEAAKDGIGKAWDAIKAKVKEPIRAVVGFINEGLIDRFNKIPGVNVKRLALPRGFAHGGYTGDGGKYDPAGVVHKGEYVFTKEQTAALGKGRLAAMASAAVRGQAALGAPMAGSQPFIWQSQQQSAKRAGVMNYQPMGGFPMATLTTAANAWNGLAGIRTNVQRPGVGGYSGNSNKIYVGRSAMSQPGMLGYYQGSSIQLAPSLGKNEMGVLVHEIGHSLGIHHNTGNHSVMHPYMGGGGSMWPTRYDQSNLQRLYGAPGSGGRTADGTGEGSTINPLDGVVDWFAGKLKEKFPGGGMFIDAAGGLAKQGIGQVVKMVTDIKNGIKDIAGNVFDSIKGFFGGGAAAMAPTLYDNGGVLSPNGGRPQLVQNKTGKPEYIFTNREMQALTNGNGSGVVINGNVGWMPDQVAREIEVRRRRAQTMAGMDGVVFA